MRTRHSAFWRYTAFQVPGWVLASLAGWWLRDTFGAPLWLAAGVPVAWVIKDYALYPMLRSAYEADYRRRIEHLIGAEGTAVEPLDPVGYVRVRGELWRARPHPAAVRADKGCVVEVTGTEGTTLVVTPRRGPDAPDAPAGHDGGNRPRGMPGTTSSAFA